MYQSRMHITISGATTHPLRKSVVASHQVVIKQAYFNFNKLIAFSFVEVCFVHTELLHLAYRHQTLQQSCVVMPLSEQPALLRSRIPRLLVPPALRPRRLPADIGLRKKKWTAEYCRKSNQHKEARANVSKIVFVVSSCSNDLCKFTYWSTLLSVSD